MRSRTALAVRQLATGLLALLALTGPASGQQPARPIRLAGLTWSVDTTAADVGDIVRLFRAYLAGPAAAGDSVARAAGLWQDMDDVAGWPAGDLTRPFGVYQGTPPTIVGVTSAVVGDSVYMVKALYATADSTGAVRPLALQRLYAVRSPGSPFGWKLTGALGRITRDWQRLTAGPIHFRYAPGLHPDSARAARAATFVDSVARLFQVPPPATIGYLVAHSPDEYFRALGLDYYPDASGRGSATGGQGGGGGMLLAGDPRLGEAYFHELTHVVLQRICCGSVTMGEGVAVWLGGSKGRTTRELYGDLAAYQRAHPDVPLRKVIDPDFEGLTQIEGYEAAQATNALLIESVFRRKGMPAVRALLPFRGTPDEFLALVARDIPELAKDPNGWWRKTAAAYAEGP